MAQGKKYPWKKIAAELRLRPGQWRLFPEMTGVPVTLVRRIRNREARALRFPDGKIYARRSIHLAHKDDAVITDVWLCWRPTTKENPNAQADDTRRITDRDRQHPHGLPVHREP